MSTHSMTIRMSLHHREDLSVHAKLLKYQMLVNNDISSHSQCTASLGQLRFDPDARNVFE